ncbi:S1C family serine protease [Novosphingobium aquimarinum]|uniref:S1C family serine protease n=1 Tax=Novosphingobium aquimarinum TaxID=2682494 RepID=UPI0018DB73A5|nr:serine protease [Novosphingobium aquimarinum]
MLRILLFLATVIASLTIASPSHAEQADINAAARGAVRVVLLEENGDEVELVGYGSGLAIARNLVLTNAHVVQPAQGREAIRIGVVPPQGQRGTFTRVLAVSPRNDLALLQIDEGSLPPISLFTGSIADGAQVFAVGYPGSVDFAQGLDPWEIISPMSPVKTQGTVSAGRSAKGFETLLHTAPIGAGNSGGPLLDACGRAIGVNSFGTIAGEADSEFFFAVSIREVMRFLTAAKVKPMTTGAPCRSIADLDREQASRDAAQRERDRMEDLRRTEALRVAERDAQLDILSERENTMALAGLALILAVVCAAAAFVFAQQDDRGRDVKIAIALAIAIAIFAVVTWLSRPKMKEATERARDAVAEQQERRQSSRKSDTPLTGSLVCVLDNARSRITVSPTTDVPFTWSGSGCVNGRSQYGLGADGWSRILVPNEEQTVTIASYDPDTATYRTDRFLLDLETMDKLRAKRGEYEVPSCKAGDGAARELGSLQDALRALLPQQPNERLVYRCSRAP